jgi:regulator of sigma E protease
LAESNLTSDAAAPKKGLPVTEIIFAVAIVAAIYFFVLKGKSLEDALRSILSIGLAIVGIGFIIFIHELGHFLAAKWCDVKVETFAVGIGPMIPGLSFRRGETRYGIGWFPIGGYVKMLGQVDDPNDTSQDATEVRESPRSYKNKRVGQRMLIISAGVIMNLILGFLLFIIVYFFGHEEVVGKFGTVSPGSPAEAAGLEAGSELIQVAGITHPWYNDLNMTTAFASPGQTQIPLKFRTPRGEIRDVIVVPQKGKFDPRPTIGIGMPQGTRLLRFAERGKPPALPWLPAAKADFLPADVVTGIKPASASSFLPVKNGKDIHLIESRYRDQPLVYQVSRGDKTPEAKTVEVTVQPGHMQTFGLRMKMGPVVAVTPNRPAFMKDLQPGDDIQAVNGDVEFDPMRLPDLVHDLVTQGKPVTLQVTRWDTKFEIAVDAKTLEGRGTWIEQSPVNNSPMAFPALGFSYRVERQIAAVTPGSLAEQAGLKAGDVVKKVHYEHPEAGEINEFQDDMDFEERYAWPYLFVLQQEMHPPTTQYTFTVVGADGQERTTKPIQGVPDPTWFRPTRGLGLEPEMNLRVAENVWDAIVIGARESYRFVGRIYLNLYSLIRGDMSVKMLSGPIKLAEFTYRIAYQGFIDLLHFLAIISINLAVVNFLPIPVLDGGHMALLIAEKVRGRPLNDTWTMIVSYIGLAIVATLMLSTIFLDITKYAWFQKLFNW